MYFNNFFDEFPIGFGKPKFYFVSDVKDMMPTCWKEIENGYEATVKTLGIEEANVEIVDNGVHVFGKNTLQGKDYEVDISLPIADDILSNLTDVQYKTIAGLTFVQLIISRPEKKKINIKKF